MNDLKEGVTEGELELGTMTTRATTWVGDTHSAIEQQAGRILGLQVGGSDLSQVMCAQCPRQRLPNEPRGRRKGE